MELTDDQRQYLLVLLGHEWYQWDQARGEARSHQEYERAFNRQTLIDGILTGLRLTEKAAEPQ